MAKYTIIKEFAVDGDVTLDEAVSAVETFGNGYYGRDYTADGTGIRINTYRNIPQPDDWDAEEQGKWSDSDEYKALQVWAEVRLVNKTVRR